MSVKFQPLYEFVLISPDDRELIQDGVYLPESSREDMKSGVVVAVGEGYVNQAGEVRSLRLKVGDKVLFGPYAGNPIQLEGQPFLIMREGAVFGRMLYED